MNPPSPPLGADASSVPETLRLPLPALRIISPLAVGTMQINGNVSLNGLFGRPAQTSLSYATVADSRELQYWTLSHTDVITTEGTTLAATYGTSASEPGMPTLRALEQRSDSDTWSIKLAHPFIRTRQENLSGSIKYEQKDTTSKSLGAVTSQDKTRSIRLGLSYDKADAFDGVNQAILEHSIGLKGMGAIAQNSPVKSRVDGLVNYRKTTLSLSRKQELGILFPELSRFSVNAALMGQTAPGGLLSGEECGLGGQQFGRAYDSSEITGDRCIAASVELRFAPNVEGTSFKYAQFYGFYDGGRTTNENPLSAADPSTKSLSSAGLGLAAEIALEAGRPSAEHVLNVLARLKDGLPALQRIDVGTPALKEEPKADVQRYDRLREARA